MIGMNRKGLIGLDIRYKEDDYENWIVEIKRYFDNGEERFEVMSGGSIQTLIDKILFYLDNGWFFRNSDDAGSMGTLLVKERELYANGVLKRRKEEEIVRYEDVN